MKKDMIKRLNALTLLIVFSLNTVVGLACSVGLDMGFNNSHHDKEASENNSHHHEADSKEHHHRELATDNHLAKTGHIAQNEKDNCCKNEVIKFAKVNKQTSRSIDVNVPVFVFVAIVPSYPSFDVIASGMHKPNKWYFVRCHHPPIDDIRIAIQSFQI
ncbi:MAG: hypothetical protein WC756_10965 [Taibaiella sp.]|jgi:ABC-type Zn2+ transport system substrate-binding protein/surface adhesin